MPNVNGKKFPYTAKGIKAAMAASKKKKPNKKSKQAKSLMKASYK